MNTGRSRARDLVGSPLRIVFWWLPVSALAGLYAYGSAWPVPEPLVTVVFAVSFGLMASGCLLNYFRCRRVHCLFTGPFFLAVAVASLLQGTGNIAPGWHVLGNVALAGGLALWFLPEWLLGRYFPGSGGPGEDAN